MSTKKTLHLDLGERSYPIYIGSDILNKQDLIAPNISGKKVMVVTNTAVAPLYLEGVLQQLDAFDTTSVTLPDGEEYKTLDTLNTIYTALLENRFDRNCTLVALGGGVVGDITGYAAASYQRGVSFIQIPTTLLAQVDSSVGGKTGVNHALGKNMIGAFHQPKCVVADTLTLSSLSDEHLRAGLAEVIKYGTIDSVEFFDWLESNIQSLLSRDHSALEYAIDQSCRHKARIVAEDEREQGKRALLNLGHTFGHAIETASGYGSWLHGYAVAAGMCMAAQMSVNLGWMSVSESNRLTSLIEKAGLPTKPPAELDAQQLLELMSLDKKVRDGALNLILMKGIGKSLVTADYARDCLVETLVGYYS